MPKAKDKDLTFQQFCIGLDIPECCLTKHTTATENKRTFTIASQPGDDIWRLKVDHCWLSDQDSVKTDYLFWCKNSGHIYIFLVELKGRNFNHALEQVEGMLHRLCKRSAVNIVHHRDVNYQSSPGHDLSSSGGVRAYVVLSNGSAVQFNQKELKRIQKVYNVIVYPKSVKQEIRLPLQ